MRRCEPRTVQSKMYLKHTITTTPQAQIVEKGDATLQSAEFAIKASEELAGTLLGNDPLAIALTDACVPEPPERLRFTANPRSQR